MSGENIRRLQRAVLPMSVGDVETSRSAWSGGATSLANVEAALNLAEPGIIAGFGEGTDIATTAKKAIEGMRNKVVERKADMDGAFKALADVKLAMQDAQEVALAQSDVEAPGPAPTFPSDVGPDEDDQIRALKLHGMRTRLHNDRVAAYDDADIKAQKALAALDKAYDEAIPVFQKIHGEPVDEPTGRTPGTGPGGIPSGVRPPTYTPPPGVLIGIHDDDDDDRDPHIDIDDPRDPDIEIGDPDWVDPPELPDLDDPRDPDIGGPGGPGTIGGPGGINPGLVGGGLLAGGLVAPGAVNGIRGLLSRGGLTSGAPAIGSTTRAGGPGALGRGGALAPGSPVARGAGARGAGGAGGARGAGARGVPGSQGGRGGRGGRGAVGAAGGRGGRRKDGDREDAERELYDDGQDWLDDEGTAPGVLG